MKMSFCPWALALVAGSCMTVRAETYQALIGRTGEVAITNARGGTVATVRPGLFETGWVYHVGVVDGSEPGHAVIRCADGRVNVRVVTTVSRATDGSTLQIHSEFVPDGALRVNNIHLAAALPSPDWVGGKWTSGGESGPIPRQLKESGLHGSNDAIALHPEHGTAWISLGGAGLYTSLQDNRAWGTDELELRVSANIPTDYAWQSGDKKVVDAVVKLDGPVTVDVERPVILKAGPNWIPMDDKADIVPGSALDFSFLTDAPAGKHGRVIVRPDGHFGFERGPSKPVRFYGVNLCFSANYLDHATADRLAERLQRIGYNTIRIHHYESGLVQSGGNDSLTFSPDALDKLDYLVAACKKRGIYTTTDLFVSRPIRPNEGPSGDGFKIAVLVLRDAFQNWADFSRKLLNHVNPYTKLAWKDDPAVAWLSTLNEPNLSSHWNLTQSEPLRGPFRTAWQDWLRQRYGTDSALSQAWGKPAKLNDELPAGLTNDARGRDLGAFMAYLHSAGFRKMRQVLRNEIGTKALLTYMNGWSEVPAFMASRADFDYVDNHFYWDHPRFLGGDWRLPSEGWSGGGSAAAANGSGPEGVSMTRLYGKPFTVSEFNYTAPNPFRAEGGMIMGAKAALQDWDALWRFAYSHSAEDVARPGRMDYFNMADDPAGLAADRNAVLLFTRGDVSPAPHAVAQLLSRKELLRPVAAPAKTNLERLTNATRVGVMLSDARPDDSMNPRPVKSDTEAASLYHLYPAASETAQFRFLPGGVMGLMTPRTYGLVGPATTTLGDKTASITLGDAWATVCVSALDTKPLTTSRRILITLVTDVQNTNLRYASQTRRVLEDWGNLPHLVAPGTATVRLTRADAAKLKAWRLDTSGARVAAVPIQVAGGAATLKLNNVGPDGKASLYFEVAVE